MAQRYRDLAAPTQPETVVIDSGASDLSSQIQQAMRVTQGAALDIGSSLRAQEGAKQGQADAAAKIAKPREGFSAATPYGKAYNNAAETTYVNDMRVDMAATRDKLERQFEGKPEGFKAAFDGYYRGLVSGMPADYRPQADLIAKTHYLAGLSEVEQQAHADTQAQARAALIDSTPDTIKTVLDGLKVLPRDQGDAVLVGSVYDYDAQLAKLEQSGALKPEQRVQLKQKFQQELENGLLHQRVDEVTSGLKRDLTRDTGLANDKFIAFLDGDATDAEKELVTTQFAQDMEADHRVKARAFTEDIANLDVRIASGESGNGVVNEARRLLRLNAITPAQYESNKRMAALNAIQASKKQDDVLTFDQIVASGGFDPGNDKHRKVMDSYFDTTTAGMDKGSAQWQQYTLDLVHRFNILPAGAESWARVNLMQNAPPERQALAAMFLRRVQTTNPTAWEYNKDPKITAFADQVADAVEGGMLPEQAASTVTKKVFEVTPQQQERLDAQYRKDKVFENNPSELQSLMGNAKGDRFDTSWLPGGVPTAPLAMQAEFDGLVKQFYPLYDGDKDKARQAAWNSLQRTWGISRVNGQPQVMKYPPEGMSGLPPEVVRNDIDQTLTQLNFQGDKANVKLTESPYTASSSGRVWGLAFTNEDGLTEPVLGPDNRPVLYGLPDKPGVQEANQRLDQAKRDEGQARRLRMEQARKQAEIWSQSAMKFENQYGFYGDEGNP